MSVQAPNVDIHYLRPPDSTIIYSQALVLDEVGVKITLASDLRMSVPVVVDGSVVLEDGSSAVWFTFPDAWHDIGLFHRSDGAFTGTYANVITPCVFESPTRWSCTDLFLDVWIGPMGPVQILDEEELLTAEKNGWVTPETASLARREAERLRERAEAGTWPPPVVREWSLPRARAALD